MQFNLHLASYQQINKCKSVSCTSTMSKTKLNPIQENKMMEPTQPNSAAQAQARVKTTTGLRYDDPSLNKSTWSHRFWVTCGCTTVLIALAKSICTSTQSHIRIGPIFGAVCGYFFADIVTGFYHWAIDNYGNVTTPVFGGQIEAFQVHHEQPWIFTRRHFANNLYELGMTVTLIFLPMNLYFENPTLLAFLATFEGFALFCQQFHAWSHTTKSKLNPVVVILQDYGVLVSRSQHAEHHRVPYNNNYCIVSGAWNKILDNNKVFDALERVIFRKFGVRPRSWGDTSSEWTEDLAHTSENIVEKN